MKLSITIQEKINELTIYKKALMRDRSDAACSGKQSLADAISREIDKINIQISKLS